MVAVLAALYLPLVEWNEHPLLYTAKIWALFLMWTGVTSPQTVVFGNPDGRSAFLPTSIRPHAGRLSREVMWSAIWLREPMELLSAVGSYVFSTTQHMPWAIRLSPASRYLRPSSYLRHALLLGFSSSPPPLHSAMFVVFYISLHLLFVLVNLCILDILPSLCVAACRLLLLCFYLCSYLFGQTVWQLITHHYCLFLGVSLLPNGSLNFSLSFTISPFSLGCAANPKYIKNHCALSELHTAI